MSESDKKLLLIDLCARVPYHPKGHVVNACNGAECDEWLTCATFTMFANIINNCRLYLRPMSSMTEEEKRELLIYILDDRDCIKYFKVDDDGSIDNTDAEYQDLNNFNIHWINFDGETTTRYIDYLLKNHFDYRGLIEKGLAIEVTPENNPYK